MALISFCSVTK